MARLRLTALAAASLLAAGCSGGEDDAVEATGTTPAPAAVTTTTTTTTAPPSGDVFARIPALVDRVQPSVVSILVRTGSGGGEGSGVIWDADGTIVTNDHVVADAREVTVVLPTGERLRARVRATSGDFDLAVLEVDRTTLPAATFADTLPDVGDLAVALGNPLGFENTVTAGIVSGLHRSIPSGGRTPSLVDLIQTDAPISPGNSGGALVNRDGEVIGINVAYLPPSETGAVSLGFAIPSPTVEHVVQELLRSGRIQLAFLGIEPTQVTPELASRYRLSVDEGVAVAVVQPGSAAARGGIEEGDVIVELGGQRIATVEDLFAQLRRHRPGDRVAVQVVRDGDRRELTVTLGGREGR